MGYIKHDAIIVTTYSQERMDLLVGAATRIGVTLAGPVESPINHMLTALVAPDGSKEGWPESDEGDARRARLIEWLDSQRFTDGSSPYSWAHVSYSSDDRKARVVHHAWNRRRRKAVKRDEGMV